MIISVIANIKAYKQNKVIQTLYFKIVKIASLLMFGPLYKSILQISMIFGSNFKKKKGLIALIVIFLFSGIFIALFQISNTNILYLVTKEVYFDKTEIYAGYYTNENQHMNFLLAPEITSDIVTSKTLKLFIPIFSHEEKMRQNSCGTYKENPYKSRLEQRKERRSRLLDCYKKYHQVFLNNKKIVPDYMRYYHPRTHQFGIVCYINLSDANEGKNILLVKKEYGNGNTTEWPISFQYVLQ
jgi:hypothetical protein